MKNNFLIRIGGSFVFLAIAFAVLGINVHGQDSNLQVVLPKGDWRFSAVPEASVAKHRVEAYSVKTDAPKGLAITEVGVWNGGVETVTSLRLAWRLFSIKGGQESQLFEGKSPVFEVNIKPGQKVFLDYQLTAFSDFAGRLTSKGQLSDTYLIGVIVEDVSFGKASGEGRFQRVSLTVDNTPLRRCTSSNRVAFVKASFVEACQGSPGFGCSTSSCGSCTNSRCVPLPD